MCRESLIQFKCAFSRTPQDGRHLLAGASGLHASSGRFRMRSLGSAGTPTSTRVRRLGVQRLDPDERITG